MPSQCFVTRAASIGTAETRGRAQYLGNLVSPILSALCQDILPPSGSWPEQLIYITDIFLKDNPNPVSHFLGTTVEISHYCDSCFA